MVLKGEKSDKRERKSDIFTDLYKHSYLACMRKETKL